MSETRPKVLVRTRPTTSWQVRPKSEKSKRRWLQYSLRTLMVLVLVVSLPCSWLAVKIRQKEKERRAVEEIGNLGGIVSYDYQETEAPGPAWMRKLLGDDFFSDVVSVDLYLSETQLTDDSLQYFEGLTNLQELTLADTQLTDDGLQHLRELTNPYYLNLSGTQLTDDGIKKLQQALPNCNIGH